MFNCADAVYENCQGEARNHLEMICMKLPEEKCLHSPDMEMSRCEEDEFDCGDGKCIHGLGICDNKYQCLSGKDETQW